MCDLLCSVIDGFTKEDPNLFYNVGNNFHHFITLTYVDNTELNKKNPFLLYYVVLHKINNIFFHILRGGGHRSLTLIEITNHFSY